MRRFRLSFLQYLAAGAFLLAFGLGCAATSSIQSKGKRYRYRERIGRVTRLDFRNKSTQILQGRYHYTYERVRDNEGEFYIETFWQPRNPFADEQQQGVEDARTKIILTAFPVEFTDPAGLWMSRIECLNQVKLRGSNIWVTMPLTVSAKRYFARIADDLRVEFQSGIRKY